MIAAIPSLSLIQRAIAGQEGGESNLTAEVFVEASEALSQLILSYATDPGQLGVRAVGLAFGFGLRLGVAPSPWA